MTIMISLFNFKFSWNEKANYCSDQFECSATVHIPKSETTKRSIKEISIPSQAARNQGIKTHALAAPFSGQ